ncbi:nuclear pore complex protein Nup153 [Drosophila navojoa]|uniref:nuclear pore complex protein Nup153 n=1 Tax=Drosophila navojoa TaxID=7232 RepID=UPI0011BF3E5A|nr:nuclear pore complex protein Nup153 [Drosophila navojoa]
MSAFVDGQQQPQEELQQQQTQTPRTPLRLTNEAGNNNNTSSSSSGSSSSGSGSKPSSNNNSIMGKVKLRVSSILPDSLSKWFSPSAVGNLNDSATEQESSTSNSQSSSQQSTAQHNGSALLTTQFKPKRSRRRIQLEADDAGDNAVDDGTSAQDLNEEEVQLADNIAEHDLAGEDEQTLRNEYNVSLLRKRQLIASDDDDDDDDEDEEGEDEDDDELDEGTHQNNHRIQQANRSVNYRSSTAQPLQKRKRIEPPETTFSPQFSAQQRRPPQLLSSTPANSEAVRSNVTPHRFSSHLNLYGNQRQREPAFTFLSTSIGGNSSSISNTNIINEAAVATSGDLPMSSRRSLNIAPMTERRETALPSYKRQSLLGHRGLTPNWRSYQAINEELPIEEQQQQQQANNNNNNTIKLAKRSTDLQSECESTESQATAGRMHNNNNNINSENSIVSQNNNSNSNSLFYGNLQSRKSVFKQNLSSSMLQQNQHHNSTLSLNSLNNRRRFNASIYGSTSALSDSRLLSTTSSNSNSILAGNSPFYQGPTAFGGSSANNRYFSQGNLTNIINSGGSSPAASNSDGVCSNSNQQSLVGRHHKIGGNIGRYGLNSVGVLYPGNPSSKGGVNDSSGTSASSLSYTAKRILDLLENHRTPLMDAKKMGSTLREHKMQRTSRNLKNGTISSNNHCNKPYAYPNHSIAATGNNNSICNSTAAELGCKSNLMVPTMLQLLDRRRLTRVPSRSLTDTKELDEQQKLHHRPQSQEQQEMQQPQQQLTANATSSSFNHSNSSTNLGSGTQNHTNKIRSRLSHQVRKDARSAEEQKMPPAPIDLPNIRFPMMASEPKFDLIIAPSDGLATTSADQQDKLPDLNNDNNDSSSCINNYRRGHFLFESPIPVLCVNPNEDPSQLQKRIKLVAYTFSEPCPMDAAKLSAEPKALQFNGESTTTTTTTTTNTTTTTASSSTNSKSNDNKLPESTSTFGFGDQFKKSASEWECEACMLRNKQELQKCIACESPKPTAKPAATSATATSATAMPAATLGFGDRFKQPSNNWECSACMLSNKDERSKCIACETPRKTISTDCKVSIANIAGSNSVSNSSSSGSSNSNNNGFGDAFKRPSNMWECSSCMILSPATVTECPACQTPNPKSNSTAPSTTNNTGSSFKFGFASAENVEPPKPDAGFQQLIKAQKASTWSCEACMAQNDESRKKCICCEQLKPGATAEAVGTADVPKFMFGFPAKSTAAETTTTTSAAAITTSGTETSSAPATSSFTFGFAAATTAGKDVADSNKPQAAVTTTTTTAAAAAATPTKAATATSTSIASFASPSAIVTTATGFGSGSTAPNAGNGPISTLFGNVNSPFSSNTGGVANSVGSNSITSPLTNIFGAGNNTQKPATGLGATATPPSTGATAPKMAFNFTPTATPTAGVFNFSSNAAAAAGAAGGSNALPKPAFNFTDAAPQTSAFNFSANSATAGNTGSRDSVRSERLFQFGATGPSTDAGASSSMMPATNNQMFNFTATAQPMQSTPSAAPFQFNAGSPASSNIFAFNPPPNAGGPMQNSRRKMRATTRRMPPR